MRNDVPILLPLVNGGAIDIVKEQATYTQGGFIVTNSNCASTGITVVLKVLHEAFGVESVMYSTLQALSGAGYPGVASLDIADNVIPYIGGEEPKLEVEPQKMLGKLVDGRIEPLSFSSAASCHRVSVTNGHTVSASVKLKHRPAGKTKVEVAALALEALRNYKFDETILALPSMLDRSPLVVFGADAPSRPQPRLDRDSGGGMTISVGRVRDCPVFDVRLTTVSHNAIIGAAGCTLLNAEVAHARGLLRRRTPQQ
eukprot:Filipodium_phascolosomae@DN1449_c0_g1_i1.p1